MSYYLKKTTLKGRTYLSIDESFYSNDKKGTAHRCFKSLGSVETLMKNGIDDPVSFYKAEVDKLNKEANEKKVKEIRAHSGCLGTRWRRRTRRTAKRFGEL